MAKATEAQVDLAVAAFMANIDRFGISHSAIRAGVRDALNCVADLTPVPNGAERLPRILDICNQIIMVAGAENLKHSRTIYDTFPIPVPLVNMLHNLTDDLIEDLKK